MTCQKFGGGRAANLSLPVEPGSLGPTLQVYLERVR